MKGGRAAVRWAENHGVWDPFSGSKWCDSLGRLKVEYSWHFPHILLNPAVRLVNTFMDPFAHGYEL